MLIARASGFAMFNVDMSGNARFVVTFPFPATCGEPGQLQCPATFHPRRYIICRAFISALGLTSCERL